MSEPQAARNRGPDRPKAAQSGLGGMTRVAMGISVSRDKASLRPQPARSGADWWPTPQCLTAALLRCVLPRLAGPIWEPAAGDGRLAAAMHQAGRIVLAS